MAIEIKICGINDGVGFDAAVSGAADVIGFVFAQTSPRFVTPDQAALLSARHTGGPLRAGLFVLHAGDDLAGLHAATAALDLDILQIYSNDQDFKRVRDALPAATLWRSYHVQNSTDLPHTSDGAAKILIEPRPQASDTRPGGLGRALDWGMLRDWQPPFPWMLAGGLTPQTVAAAIRKSGATAVDVSSGVESAPGQKSPEKILAFIAAARHAAAAAH